MGICAGDDSIPAVYVGEMGIKEIYAGDESVYNRPGGYIYVELITQEE